ncbi:MAG: hypothetical protein R3F04_07750 [Lysobacteraceae bacterium]
MCTLWRHMAGLMLLGGLVGADALAAQTVGYQLQLYPEYRLERFTLPDVHNAAVVGPVSQPDLYALAHDPQSGELLTAGAEGAGVALGRLDPETAVWTYLDELVGVEGNVMGLATLGGDEPLYVVTWNGDGTRLYTVDRSTGEGTLRNTFLGRMFVDIAIDDAGLLFAHCILGNAIYRIDTTGSEVLIGSTGLVASYAQGMDFDRSSGELFAWIYVADDGATAFSHIDLSTGAATVLHTLAGEFEGVLTGLGSRLFRDGFEP